MIDFQTLRRTWIVDEIGVNHEGDEKVATDLIEKAARAGVDAVKFQTFEIEHYISTTQPDRWKRTKGFQLSREAFRRLRDVARANGVVFFSTPFGLADVDFLDKLATIFKVSSGDLTFLELIRYVATKNKPIIISKGLGTEAEIEAAVETVFKVRPSAETDGSLMLMHCVAAYPTEASDANLRNLLWLKQRFGLPVGYSDHTLGIKACELAVAVGAVALEKHFTYRKEDQTFHDHKISADPKDLTDLVAAVRQAETYLGRFDRLRTEDEKKVEAHMRRSIGAARDIKGGTPITREALTWLRPAWGLPVDALPRIVGRTLKRDISKGELIRHEDLAS